MGFVWDNSLKIGIPEIDEQHKQLIDQMNLLIEAMKKNKAKEEVREILNFLDVYVDKHFSYEEGCMHRYKCPVADENKMAHAKFVNTLKEVREKLEKDGPSLTLVMTINHQLLSWFINHIRKIDTQLTPCVL